MTTQQTKVDVNRLIASHAELLALVELDQCEHDNTHRGGAIWTICDDCGRKWADDRGGFQPYVAPDWLVEARAVAGNVAQPEAPTPSPELTARMVAENDRLRKAIERALRCTPTIGNQYVGLSGMTYRQVIKYDCGDPWAILREALAEPVDLDTSEAERIAYDMEGALPRDLVEAGIKAGRALAEAGK